MTSSWLLFIQLSFSQFIFLLFALLLYRAWQWLLYVAETCSCHHRHRNTVVTWWVVFLSIRYNRHHKHFQHILPITCLATLCSKSVQAVTGKNLMFVKSGNMANMNFLHLLGQYPVGTSLALLAVLDKLLVDFLNFSRWILKKYSHFHLWCLINTFCNYCWVWQYIICVANILLLLVVLILNLDSKRYECSGAQPMVLSKIDW